MKREILFVHSAGPQGANEGSDYLVKYLRQQLGEEFRVRYPKMPDPENPDYITWKMALSEFLMGSDDQVILIGHSLGGSILLKYLSEEIFRKDIVGLFIVAAPFWGKENWKLEEFEFTPDFVSKLPSIPQVFLYHSQDDEIVAPSHQQYYLEKFPNATARKLDGYGHIFGRGLPELVMDLKNLCLPKEDPYKGIIVEVFKTNVCNSEHAYLLLKNIHEQFPEYKANFDLEDCDKILRIQCRNEIDALSVIEFTKGHGVLLEVL